MKRIVLTFGLLALSVILLLQLSRYSLFTYSYENTGEYMAIAFAVIFIAFGLVVARVIMKPRVVKQKIVVEPPQEIDQEKIDELGISKREYEVLEQISQGKSNQEIAETLFISENTVKTHVSSLLVKLDAKRRTQAVSHAKEMGILV